MIRKEIPDAQAATLLQGITIPPQPATLVDLNRERAKGDPDLRVIARIIERDLSVSASVIKTVNSPFFGLPRKLDSVSQAVLMLGVTNVVNIVTALSLRSSLCASDNPSMDRMFDTATDVALVMSGLARDLHIMPADRAYTLGLFHDCGMPLLLQRFPHYKDVLRLANATPDTPMTAIEDQQLGTDHTTVGYLVSKNWGLPEDIGQIILNHHRVNELVTAALTHPQSDECPQAIISAIALLAMAEDISYRFRHRTDHHEWNTVSAEVLAYLGLEESDFQVLVDEQVEKLAD